jgi:hypothetical protein
LDDNFDLVLVQETKLADDKADWAWNKLRQASWGAFAWQVRGCCDLLEAAPVSDWQA